MRELHTRQPVILDPAYYDVWLSPESPWGDLKEILSHDMGERLELYRVGREVNSTNGGVDHTGLIGPLNPL